MIMFNDEIKCWADLTSGKNARGTVIRKYASENGFPELGKQRGRLPLAAVRAYFEAQK